VKIKCLSHMSTVANTWHNTEHGDIL
jgi:hypothetical protein